MPPATRAVFLEEMGMTPGFGLDGVRAGGGGGLDDDPAQGWDDVSHGGENVHKVFEHM